jgi:hypothetical protein
VRPSQLCDWVKKFADDPQHARRNRHEVRFHCEAPGDLAGGVVMRGARWLAGRLLCLADTTTQSAHRSDEELGAKVRASFVASERTYGEGGCGAICWQKGCHVDCIGLSG